MKSITPCVLAINGGSSSIRFAIYDVKEPLSRRLSGKMDRVGMIGTEMTISDAKTNSQTHLRVPSGSHESSVNFLTQWLEKQTVFNSIAAIGHRVVHGMSHSEPERITPELIAELHRITPYDPEHLPQELKLIELFQKKHPTIPQLACFDTAFHRTMPPVAKLLPIPRRYSKMASSAMVFMACPTPISCRNSHGSIRKRQRAASSSPISETERASPLF